MGLPVIMSVKEFSQNAGLPEKQVRTFCHVEGFPAFCNGVKYMIHFDEAKKWLADYAVKFTIN